MIHAPLAGLRVLELARLLPGPMVTRKFADLGAEVVKVEEPDRGDYLRWHPPIVDGAGVLFNMVNRGKKSIALDINTKEGVRTFLELADVADVVVEGSRPGAFLKSGLDWREVRKKNPQLVICSVSGFGQTGPLAQLPSHGYVMDALAGALTLVETDGELKSGKVVGWSIEIGTACAALTTLAAVMNAKQTGEGAWIDASMWDAAVEAQRATLGPLLAGFQPYGSVRSGPLGGVYIASDGKPVVLTAVEQRFWINFCRGAGREDLIDCWGGAGSEGRGEMASGDERLREEIRSIIAGAPADVWTQRFVEWSVAGGMVVDPAELLESPHFKSRGLVCEIDGQSAAVLGDPMRLIDPDVRVGLDSAPPPVLGADTEEVLSSWLKPEAS